MQPYFFPYAGYFRLLAGVDEFVVYDCVQFPRRGRVHRCQVPAAGGGENWLTLPLQPQARDVRIDQIRFPDDARAELDARLARLPWLAAGMGPHADAVRAHLYGHALGDVVDFLVDGLRLVAGIAGIDVPMRRSSSLGLPTSLRGQDRILAICESTGADAYLNAPGGRELYSPEAFAAAGVALEFLPEYTGSFVHLLPALVRVDARALRADIVGGGVG